MKHALAALLLVGSVDTALAQTFVDCSAAASVQRKRSRQSIEGGKEGERNGA
jgi:hypothetical protein